MAYIPAAVYNMWSGSICSPTFRTEYGIFKTANLSITLDVSLFTLIDTLARVCSIYTERFSISWSISVSIIVFLTRKRYIYNNIMYFSPKK